MSSPAEPGEEQLEESSTQSGSVQLEKSLRVCGPRGSFALRYGLPCPFCLVGRVDYDCQLNLVCGNCGKTQTGVFT